MKRSILLVFCLAAVFGAFAVSMTFAGSASARGAASCTPSTCYFTLTSPDNGAQVTWVRGGSINFTWTASFYCGGSADFCNLYDTVEITATTGPGLSGNVVLDKYVGVCNPDCPTSYSAPFSDPGTYYWQVSVRGHDTVTPSSGVSSFTLVPAPPQIASFTPSSGAKGTTVTLMGSGFTGATAVKFNGTTASYNTVNDTQISATVPAGASTGPISVTTASGTGTSSDLFTVPPTPASLVVKKTGKGLVADAQGNIKCGPTCSKGQLTPGSHENLTATAARGWKFNHWAGACTGRKRTCSISLTSGPNRIKAVFVKKSPIK
jgi:hypothetical protein